jgi:Rps23 Pro-64 3,4-dihydroxylase Tpa1-like proline 4-hydroxylase
MTKATFWPMLNPGLDIEAAKAEFAFKRRVHIPAFLDPDSAETIHNCLMTETPWGFAYMDGTDPRIMHRRELEGLTRARTDRVAKTITSQASQGQLSFGYFCYPMQEAVAQGWNEGLALHEVLSFLGSEQILAMIRSISGKAGLARAEAQAVLYSHQHFLTVNEGTSGSSDKIAFMLNMTKDWREDWGGYLQFYNKSGDILQGFKPDYNSLILFAVPQRHSISYVPPYAKIGRIAITGWFR